MVYNIIKSAVVKTEDEFTDMIKSGIEFISCLVCDEYMMYVFPATYESSSLEGNIILGLSSEDVCKYLSKHRNSNKNCYSIDRLIYEADTSIDNSYAVVDSLPYGDEYKSYISYVLTAYADSITTLK